MLNLRLTNHAEKEKGSSQIPQPRRLSVLWKMTARFVHGGNPGVKEEGLLG